MPQEISVQDLIREEAGKQGVPPELALAVAEQESQFNPNAQGIPLPHLKGERAIGTFQVLPSTAKARGFDPTNPSENIRGGVGYLRELLDKHQGNLNEVLKEYGGVKKNTTYVPQVRGRIGKFQTAPAAPTTPPASTTTPPPKPSSILEAGLNLGKETLKGFDPRTQTGRRNLAGAGGGILATIAAPEIAGPIWLMRVAQFGAPLVGAYLGGAGEAVAEDVVTGKAPSLASAQSVGREQMGNEALGQAVAWPLKIVGRTLAKGPIGRSISSHLSEGIEAAKARIGSLKPTVTPAQAGRMVEATAQGPAKAVRNELGEAVETAAKGGPNVPTAEILAKLDEAASQLNPVAQQTAVTIGGQKVPAGSVPPKIAAMLGPSLPSDHPLPGILNRARDLLADKSEITFEEAHKFKRMLDDAVNWDSPAKKQAQQLTKGLRQTLRSEMVHPEYDLATEQYGKVAKLYEKGSYPKLHKEILANPEGVVSRLDWRKPSSAKLLRDLTVDVSKQSGMQGAHQGEAAWNALRAAYTHEKIVVGGPKAMMATIQKMEASGSGQEFIQTLYGDPQGQLVWNNLKQLGSAWEQAVAREAQFGETRLAKQATQPGATLTHDIIIAGIPGHHFGKVSAFARLLGGVHSKDMIQWAAYSPKRTQTLIRLLTGPAPGQAISEFYRYWKSDMGLDAKEGPPRPEVTPGGPPKPSALNR